MVIFTVVLKKYDSESWGFLSVIQPEHMVRLITHNFSNFSAVSLFGLNKKGYASIPGNRVIFHPLLMEVRY